MAQRESFPQPGKDGGSDKGSPAELLELDRRTYAWLEAFAHVQGLTGPAQAVAWLVRAELGSLADRLAGTVPPRPIGWPAPPEDPLELRLRIPGEEGTE